MAQFFAVCTMPYNIGDNQEDTNSKISYKKEDSDEYQKNALRLLCGMG
jgi:hypothetical protein